MENGLKKASSLVIGIVFCIVVAVLILINGAAIILPHFFNSLSPFMQKHGFLITSIATPAALIAEIFLFVYMIFSILFPQKSLFLV